MYIRKAAKADIPAINALYAEARAFMAANGNPTQWGATHPPQSIIEQDVEDQVGYVCIDAEPGSAGVIAGVFAGIPGEDPTYAVIDGRWCNDAPYHTVHRLAAAANRFSRKGVGSYCLEWSYSQWGNIRIDTHPNNIPMQALLAKLGYRYCGIIRLPEEGERVCFQKFSPPKGV